MKFLHQAFSNNKIKIPGSKSHFQRIVLIILAHDIDTIIIKNAGLSNDDKSGLKILEENGYDISLDINSITIQKKHTLKIENFNIGESGFLTRSLLAILSVKGGNYQIIGEGSIIDRDFSHEIDFLEKNGVKVDSNNGKLPIKLNGKIDTKYIRLNASNSSQFLSGLLIGLAASEYVGNISVNSLKSQHYIDLTLNTLDEFGIKIKNDNYQGFHFENDLFDVPGKINVESDWSSASFWIVAALISKNLELIGLDINSSQADRSILKLMDSNDLNYSFQNTLMINNQSIPGFVFDATDSPDLIPILTLLAFNANSKSQIIGVNRLANKESNRKEVLKTEFKKLGGIIEEESDKFIIHPTILNSGKIDSHNDHRIAMTFIIATITNRLEIEIDDVNCIDKSYPQFIDHYKSLGGIVNE